VVGADEKGREKTGLCGGKEDNSVGGLSEEMR
jgi:hypothetical protein